MSGPTYVVTGASSGIGLQACLQLATPQDSPGQHSPGRRLVMVGRNPERTAAAAARVRAAAGPDVAVDAELADLGSQRSVRDLADRLLAAYPRIDVLVNNAGAVYARRTETVDGIESTFAVNHLGGYLLTELLLDRLIASAPARIVFTSSTAHHGATMDFDDLGFARGGYRIMDAYGRSKLANVLYARRLAARLAGTGVTVNAVHPGTVATSIWSGAPWFARPVLAVAKRFMISPDEGGRALVHLATSPDLEGRTGGYYDGLRPAEPSATARDEAVAARLDDESRKLVGLP